MGVRRRAVGNPGERKNILPARRKGAQGLDDRKRGDSSFAGLGWFCFAWRHSEFGMGHMLMACVSQVTSGATIGFLFTVRVCGRGVDCADDELHLGLRRYLRQ